MVAKVLGVSPFSGYKLMHEADFPVFKVGNRMVAPKEKFVDRVERHTTGADAGEYAAEVRSESVPSAV